MPASLCRHGSLTLLALAFGHGALASDISPEQAIALQMQVQAALAGLALASDKPVQFVPRGDHYDVTVPIGGLTVTAQARPAAGGAWAIEAIKTPSPAAFTVDVPGAPPGTAARMRITATIAEQTASALFDPTDATASSLMGKYGGVRIETESADRHQVTRLDSGTTAVSSTAASAGKIDLAETVDVTGYSSDDHPTHGPVLHIAARHITVQGRIMALSLSQGAATAEASSALLASATAAIGNVGAAFFRTIDRAAAHRLVAALQNLITGFEIIETVDGVQAVADGARFGVDHATLGLAATSPTEMLSAHLDLALNGISAPSVPQEQGGDLIPRNLTLRPVVSGISMHDLSELALAGTEPDPDLSDVMVQFAALFTHGGVGFDLENVSLDAGPANIAGELHVKATGFTRNAGSGRFMAKGFDALLGRLQQIPDAQPLLPAMKRIRELARGEGDSLVWELQLQNSKLLVNGVDVLSAAPTKKL